jgi:hypothetical protein
MRSKEEEEEEEFVEKRTYRIEGIENTKNW